VQTKEGAEKITNDAKMIHFSKLIRFCLKTYLYLQLLHAISPALM